MRQPLIYEDCLFLIRCQLIEVLLTISYYRFLKKLGYEINTNPRLNLFYLVRKLYSNQLFSLSSGVTSCASAIGVDITEIPSRFHEAEVLINILLRLRNEYELRSIVELEKLY